MSQRWRIKTKRARQSLGGKLRARQGSWLDLGVPEIWQAQQILEPGVKQKPGNSGFMRWRLNGVGRVRNKAAGTSSRDVLKPRQLPLPRSLRYTSCQDKMQRLEQCVQACRWEQREEVNMAPWPGWSYIQGKVLSLRSHLPSLFFLDFMQGRMRVIYIVTTCWEFLGQSLISSIPSPNGGGPVLVPPLASLMLPWFLWISLLT